MAKNGNRSHCEVVSRKFLIMHTEINFLKTPLGVLLRIVGGTHGADVSIVFYQACEPLLMLNQVQVLMDLKATVRDLKKWLTYYFFCLV